jgi:hypothetical protein
MNSKMRHKAKAGWRIFEGDISEKYTNLQVEYSEKYYSLYRAKYMPTSFIIKAKKLN